MRESKMNHRLNSGIFFLASLSAIGIVLLSSPLYAKKGSHHLAEKVERAPSLSKAEERLASERYQQICAACHGASREGKIGPSLIGVGQRRPLAKIERIILNGKGKKKEVKMPGGLVSKSDAAVIAKWLSSQH